MPPLELPCPLVSPEWLAQHLVRPDVVVLDASIWDARDAEQTIAGGRRFDIDGALSDPDSDLPHTMPGPDRFQREVRALGIDPTSAVVFYDADGIFSAARGWWMMRAMGHENVAVLDGGLPGWIAAGLPTTARDLTPPAEGSFVAQPQDGWFVDADTVLERLEDPNSVVLDARSRGRFRGMEPEPRPGMRGGHMPGAVNLPYTDLQRDGFMLPAEELRNALDEAVDGKESITTSCGSGVTACVLALGATLAGLDDVTVYDGSWSEWGRPGPLPVATDASSTSR